MGAYPVESVDTCGESMRNNGVVLEAVQPQSQQPVDPVVRRVLAEIAALLQCDQSLRIVINKAGGGDRRVKVEVSRYLEFGGAGSGQHG